MVHLSVRVWSSSNALDEVTKRTYTVDSTATVLDVKTLLWRFSPNLNLVPRCQTMKYRFQVLNDDLVLDTLQTRDVSLEVQIDASLKAVEEPPVSYLPVQYIFDYRFSLDPVDSRVPYRGTIGSMTTLVAEMVRLKEENILLKLEENGDHLDPQKMLSDYLGLDLPPKDYTLVIKVESLVPLEEQSENDHSINVITIANNILEDNVFKVELESTTIGDLKKEMTYRYIPQEKYGFSPLDPTRIKAIALGRLLLDDEKVGEIFDFDSLTQPSFHVVISALSAEERDEARKARGNGNIELIRNIPLTSSNSPDSNLRFTVCSTNGEYGTVELSTDHYTISDENISFSRDAIRQIEATLGHGLILPRIETEVIRETTRAEATPTHNDNELPDSPQEQPQRQPEHYPGPPPVLPVRRVRQMDFYLNINGQQVTAEELAAFFSWVSQSSRALYAGARRIYERNTHKRLFKLLVLISKHVLIFNLSIYMFGLNHEISYNYMIIFLLLFVLSRKDILEQVHTIIVEDLPDSTNRALNTVTIGSRTIGHAVRFAKGALYQKLIYLGIGNNREGLIDPMASHPSEDQISSLKNKIQIALQDLYLAVICMFPGIYQTFNDQVSHRRSINSVSN
ncbi:BA75_02104T0 [Komagataella pastoris]|uniref:BA75_02104T0 n=1 Tax=Komagataella pastoris TaxID=4922 RepID=A0A1B2JAE6_PICPA|nr:BA75_02104T0 [Komagataella pastoris]